MTPEWHSAEEVMEHILGSQISDGRIDEDGLYLQFDNGRGCLVIVCLPNQCLGLALIRGERSVH